MAAAALPGRLTWRLADVVATVDETPTVRTLRLVVAGWPGHRPGQHLDVRLTAPDGYRAQRSYSIATPADGERLDLGVERLDDGEVSPYLNGELRAGDQLELRGPIGGYFVWDPSADGGPVLLIGGGSGVVPLMAMARARAQAGSTVPMRWLSSSRTLSDVVYRSELAHLAGGDGFELFQALTRDAPDDWTGHRGRIDEQLLADVAWPPESGARTYICGPTTFVEAMARTLLKLGHDPATIKTERFGATGAP